MSKYYREGDKAILNGISVVAVSGSRCLECPFNGRDYRCQNLTDDLGENVNCHDNLVGVWRKSEEPDFIQF